MWAINFDLKASTPVNTFSIKFITIKLMVNLLPSVLVV